MMYLGMSFDDVLLRTTSAPAACQSCSRQERSPGSADVAVLKIEDGRFLRIPSATVTAKQRLFRSQSAGERNWHEFSIERASLTHARVPLVEPFRISSGAVAEKDGIIVQLESDGLTGVGESSPMAGSFYSADTPESCWRELREQLVPSLLEQRFPSHAAAVDWINAHPGSHFAKAGIETALWDLEARRRGQPLFALLGGTARPVESGLAVGCMKSRTRCSGRSKVPG
jgi:hypothetical protein